MNSSINPLSSALQQMQSLASQAAGGAGNVASGAVEQQQTGAASAGSFADALRSSIDSISGAQQSAAKEVQAFEVGAPNVSLNDVMVDTQKANIGFQFGLQVRNKLVTAYNDIMNISV